jgi:5-methylcytosine-specific restriction endonuclease McrA
MTDSERKYAAWCAVHEPHRFYIWSHWLKIRQHVLNMDKGECQICKQNYHRFKRADTVHHVNHFKQRPDLALEIYYTDPATHEQKRNLISVCRECHEALHERRTNENSTALTIERWD